MCRYSSQHTDTVANTDIDVTRNTKIKSLVLKKRKSKYFPSHMKKKKTQKSQTDKKKFFLNCLSLKGKLFKKKLKKKNQDQISFDIIFMTEVKVKYTLNCS